MAYHVRVLHVPGILIRHPLAIAKNSTDGALLPRDGGFIAAQLLHAHDILLVQRHSLRDKFPQALQDRLRVARHKDALFLAPRLFAEGFARFMRILGVKAAAVEIHLHDFDVLREDGDECSGRIFRPGFLIGVDPFRRRDERGISR